MPAFLHLAVQLTDVDIVVGRLAEHLAQVTRAEHRLVHLVADDEQVALAAPLLPGVGHGVPGDEIRCQFVGFALLPAAVALQEDRPELVVHPVVRLELADLQRHPIGLGIADPAEHDLRIGDVSATLQQPCSWPSLVCMIRGTRPIEPVTSNSTAIGVLFGCSALSRLSRTGTPNGSIVRSARHWSRGRSNSSAL